MKRAEKRPEPVRRYAFHTKNNSRNTPLTITKQNRNNGNTTGADIRGGGGARKGRRWLALPCPDTNNRMVIFRRDDDNAYRADHVYRSCALERHLMALAGRLGVRSPTKETCDHAYQLWAQANNKLVEMRDHGTIHTALDCEVQFQKCEKLLQDWIELSQRFTTTLN